MAEQPIGPPLPAPAQPNSSQPADTIPIPTYKPGDTPAVQALYQQTPWEPTITSDSTFAEKEAAAEYTAQYGGSPNSTAPPPSSATASFYPAPSLSMAYTQSPDIVPTAMSGSPSGDSPDPAAIVQLDPAFSIDLAELRSVEQSILNDTANVVDKYQQMYNLVTNAMFSSSFWGQNVGYVLNVHEDVKGGNGHVPKEVVYDVLDKEGIAQANSMNPQMQLLLQQIGDAIELVGKYTALLNNAGQLYAYADSKSAFPTPGA